MEDEIEAIFCVYHVIHQITLLHILNTQPQRIYIIRGRDPKCFMSSVCLTPYHIIQVPIIERIVKFH